MGKRSFFRLLFILVVSLLTFYGSAAGQKGRCLVVKSQDMVDYEWDSQFLFYSPTKFVEGDTWEVSFYRKAKYATTTDIPTQTHMDYAGNYIFWDAVGDVSFSTEWELYTQSGVFYSDVVDGDYVAFNLNEYNPANDYYFDNISFKINGVEQIINGDFEGDDFSSFFLKEAPYNTTQVSESNLVSVDNLLPKTKEPYAVFNETDGTLTFRYDMNKPEGAYGMEQIGDVNPWLPSPYRISSAIAKVVIEPSFADFRPTTCRCWFKGFYKLKEILGLEYLNTEEVRDMSEMFAGCSSLTSLDLRGFNTCNVTTMYKMFGGNGYHRDYEPNTPDGGWTDGGEYIDPFCSLLETLDLSSFNTQNVTDMGYMFLGCKSLSNLNLSKFNTEHVTGMYGMFEGCENLKSLDLSNFNTSSVTNMHVMFAKCGNLSSLDLSSFNTSNVLNMHGMFGACAKLRTIFVSDLWRNKSVIDSDLMFTECKMLVGEKGSRCYLGADHTYAKIDGGQSSPGYFTRVGNKPYVFKFPYAIFKDGVLTLGYNNTQIPDGAVEVSDYLDYLDSDFCYESFIANKVTDAENVTKVVIDKSFADFTPVTFAYWFGGCCNMTVIEGLENLNTIHVVNMQGMFYDCESLMTLDLIGFNTENVSDMRNMFCGCSSLASLDLSSFNTQKLQYVKDMFAYCDDLKTIYVGDKWSTNSIVEYGEEWQGFIANMFSESPKLIGGKGTKYDEQHIDYTYARVDGGATAPGYFTKASTKDVPFAVFKDGTLSLGFGDSMPKDAVEISEEVATSDYIASNLAAAGTVKKIVIESSFKDYEPTTCAYWFMGCENLTEISGLENINTKKVTNMSFMFAGCSKLTVLDLSGFNTSKVTDMSGMFSNCVELNTIFVSDNWITVMVESSYFMFSNCTKLVGGKGTTYNANNTDHTYAKIDNGKSSCGFFTKYGEKPYDTTTPTSEIVFNSNLRIWSFDNTVIVEHATSDIAVVNSLGVQVLQQKAVSDRVEIIIPRPGVYVVKTGTKTQKVIIH